MMMYAVVALLVAQAATTAFAAPHIQGYRQDPYSPESTAPCDNETGVVTEVYDQRQNGSENYRINVNGVVVLLAPAETLLAAASFPNLESELSGMKPPKPTTVRPVALENASETAVGVAPVVDPCEGGKCILANSTVKQQRGKLKMMNNILQLFRNLKDDSQVVIN